MNVNMRMEGEEIFKNAISLLALNWDWIWNWEWDLGFSLEWDWIWNWEKAFIPVWTHSKFGCRLDLPCTKLCPSSVSHFFFHFPQAIQLLLNLYFPEILAHGIQQKERDWEREWEQEILVLPLLPSSHCQGREGKSSGIRPLAESLSIWESINKIGNTQRAIKEQAEPPCLFPMVDPNQGFAP